MEKLYFGQTPEELAKQFYTKYSGYDDEERALLEEGFATALDYIWESYNAAHTASTLASKMLKDVNNEEDI